jgi:guanosine-3',5'-bis(diphosphate) 3'-pyrophosphohydrolase
MAFISDCLQLMQLAHKDQRRASGRLYEEHPLAVARIYRSASPDDLVGQGVCLIHDVVQDSSITMGQLSGFLGRQVALMVDALSKRHLCEFRCREDCVNEYYARLISAARTNKRIALVKLADRYHNISTIDILGREKAAKILDETEQTLVPFFRTLRLPFTEELTRLCHQKRAKLAYI